MQSPVWWSGISMKQVMGHSYSGTAASDGLHMGPVRWLHGRSLKKRVATDPATERKALEDAITSALGDIAALISNVTGEAEDMLAFQLAMLEDEALSAKAWQAIDAGQLADLAWTSAMQDEIAGYDASEDEYFRARAADLADIRDRVLRHLSGDDGCKPLAGAVLAGEDIGPSLFLETDWSQGGAIALTRGSRTSHVAMLARARGIPMVVGLNRTIEPDSETLIVDGTAGLVISDPGEADQADFKREFARQTAIKAADKQFLQKPAYRKTGTRVEVLLNISGIDELDDIDPQNCDGIGLMRSEFLFRDGAELPDEDAQYSAYRKFVEWAEGKPVTIRTLDIGGDKPIRGLTPQGESNPFLGLRGVRLTLAREDVFCTQLKALARAAAHGNLKVMLPMVTVPAELERSRELLHSCVAELRAAGVQAALPSLGIMVEVPAVAVAPELFDGAHFFSIGSNDLTQYVTASSRDDERVAPLNDPGNPAVLRLIEQVTRFGQQAGIPVSLCGDMASEPRHLASLLQAGLTCLSVAPARLARIKATIAEL